MAERFVTVIRTVRPLQAHKYELLAAVVRDGLFRGASILCSKVK